MISFQVVREASSTGTSMLLAVIPWRMEMVYKRQTSSFVSYDHITHYRVDNKWWNELLIKETFISLIR